MDPNKEYLNSRFESFGFQASDHQLDQFIRYYHILVERNKVVNLTAVTDWKEVVDKHFVDSLMLLSAIPDLKDREYSLIDIGTGAGFPGIPLKIMCPGLTVTLLDSLDKRITFLNDVISELKLDKITAIHGRAEELSKDSQYREQFDIAVSRAVSDFSKLCELCIPYVKTDGMFAPYKTVNNISEAEESQKAFELLGCDFDHADRYSYSILYSDVDRLIFLTKKISSTPDKYPRRMSAIQNRPLVK